MEKEDKIRRNRSLNEEKIVVIQKIFFRVLEKKIREKKIEINKNKK